MSPAQRLHPRALRRAASRLACLAVATGLARGVVVGLFFESLRQGWSACFGGSLAALSAAALAVAAGIEFGWPSGGNRWTSGRARSLSLAAAALWTLALPWLLAASCAALATVPAAWWGSAELSLAVLLPVGLVLLTPAVAVLTRLACGSDGVTASVPGCAIGAGGGMLLGAVVAGPLGLFGWAVHAAAGATLLAVAYRHVRPAAANEAPADGGISGSAAPATDGFSLRDWLTIAVLGVAAAVAERISSAWWPASATVAWTASAAVAIGFGLGWWQASRDTAQRFRRPGRIGLLLATALWVVALPAIYSTVVHAVLAVSVTGSGMLAALLRTGLLTTVFLPVGWTWAVVAFGPRRSGEEQASSVGSTSHVAALAAGYLVTRWTLLGMISPPSLAAVCGGAFLSLAGAEWLRTRSRPAWRPAALAGAAVALTACGMAFSTYRPELAARLLSDPTVRTARAAGLKPAFLTALDDSRHLRTVEGPTETLTVWRVRGVQRQLRRGGLPFGLVSEDPRLCPQPSGSVLSAVVPLAVHPQPERVLVLGLADGLPLTTTLAFPVQAVTCAEGDPAVTRLLSEHVWPACRVDPLADVRLTLLPADPPLALLPQDGRFDVVISTPAHPAAGGAPELTAEFYRRAAACLREDGVFCQRFPHGDFGPDALRAVAQTLCSAFPQVALLEVEAGEVLLIGSKSAEPVDRNRVAERLEKPHVQRVLAAVGWDWCGVLDLRSIPPESLPEFIAEGDLLASTNTAASGRLAFALPPALFRPQGPQGPHNTAAALARSASWFGEWAADLSHPALQRRLEEVAGQRELMAGRPDEYWLYRKTARRQIIDNPRTLIRPVAGELPQKDIHPQDQRRMDYFRALDRALQTMDPLDVDRVTTFAEPYDPLISYFLHKEVAELYARSEPPDREAELWHRLHAEYFTAAGDKSVRNVARVLRLLAEHPETMPDPQRRWDHLDAMLQTMKLRWAARIGYQPLSPGVILNDIDRSLVAIETALAAMDELGSEAAVSKEDWSHRRRFIEKTVASPLRTYRRQILPHHARSRAKNPR